ncbi:MAG TPA: CotH kinase family protein [Verrucomicrobiae bacterium]|nr:CotH kinase family protein [Verrucomicrobiae bacterium]
MSDDAVRLLRVDHRKYVSAQVKAFGKTSTDARVRLKGSGTFQPIDEKPSFTVEFAGEKIYLNNSIDDPSSMNEFVGAHIAKRAGFTVPRVSHATVALNGRKLGLYVVKEDFNSPEVEVDDTAIDLNQFCRFMAFEVMVGHWDGYSLRGNNFHVSKDSAGRIIFNPDGMDQLFGKPDLSWKSEMTGALAQKVMATADGRAKYEAAFRTIFASVFDSKAIKRVIEARTGQLKPLLNKSDFRRLCVETAELSKRIEARESYLKSLLAAPVAGKLLDSEGFAGTADFKRRL